MITLLRFSDRYGKRRFFSLGTKAGSFWVLGIPDDKEFRRIVTSSEIEMYCGVSDASWAEKIVSAAISSIGIPAGMGAAEAAGLLASGKIAVELAPRMGSKTMTSMFPSEGFAVLRGTNVSGFNKAFGPFFDDRSVSYSAKGPDAVFARAEVSAFFDSFYIPETVFREFSFENLRVERVFAGEIRKPERYFVFFGNPGKGGRPGPKSARSIPPLPFEPGPFHKDFPMRIENASGIIVRMGSQGDFVCGDFDPKGPEYRADDLSSGLHCLRISAGAKLRYFFREFLSGEVAAGRLSEARKANVKKFIRALRGSTARFVYGESLLGFEYVMRRTRADPDGERKNVASIVAALFRVPLLICAKASAENGNTETAERGIREYAKAVASGLSARGIPAHAAEAVAMKYAGMAARYAKLMMAFCRINRERLDSVATVEQYFRIVADGLKIPMPTIPELANAKFAEAVSDYTYSEEYYVLRNGIRKVSFSPEKELSSESPENGGKGE